MSSTYLIIPRGRDRGEFGPWRDVPSLVKPLLPKRGSRGILGYVLMSTRGGRQRLAGLPALGYHPSYVRQVFPIRLE